MTIEDWRREIDTIDDELTAILNRRARIAQKVAALKRNAGLPVRDLAREREILARISRMNDGPLDDLALARIFRRIIFESRRSGSKASSAQRQGSARAGGEQPLAL